MSWANVVLVSDGLAALIVSTLLVAALRRPARSTAERALRSLFVAQLGWILSDGSSVILAVHFGFISEVHGGITGLCIVGLVLSAYVFCETYPEPGSAPRGRLLRLLLVGLPAPVFAALSFTPLWVANRRVVQGVKLGDPGPAFLWFGIWAAVVVFVGIGLLLWRYARHRDARVRANLRILAGALLLNLALSLLTSFVLPLVGVPEYDFIGPVAALVFVSLVLYAINYHALFDLETAVQSFVVHTVVASLLSVLVFAVLHGPLHAGLPAPAAMFLLGAVFLAGVGYALYLRPRLYSLFRRRPRRPDELLLRLVSGRAADLRALSFRQLLGEVLEAVGAGLDVSSGSLLAVGAEGRAITAEIGNGGPQLSADTRRALQLLQRVRLGEQVLAFLDRPVLLESQNQQYQRVWADLTARHPRLGRALLDTLDRCRHTNTRVFAPLILDRQVLGFLFLGPPRGGRPYYQKDLELVDVVRLSAAPVIRNFLYLQELNALRARAEAEAERLTEFIVASDPVRTTIHGRTMVHRSPLMERAIATARQQASGDRPLLILGETGTGKELIARLTHEERGADRPFVAVNCAAVPASLWESEVFGHARGAFTDARSDRQGSVALAGNGTLFFDEIGETPLEMQAKLLRLLQERSYTPLGSTKELPAKCRFVFATNQDLEERVAAGAFRSDLYYRINVFRVTLPPLRERREDIVPLAEYFVQHFSKELGLPARSFAPAAREALLTYGWPGNIRELENAIVRALAAGSGDSIQATDLPSFQEGASPRGSRAAVATPVSADELQGNYRGLLDDYRRRLIRMALRRTKGNKTQAAEYLGIKRTTLNSQMAELGIDEG